MRNLITAPVLLFFLFSGLGLAQGDPEIIWMVEGHTNSIEAVAYSPDGQIVASGADYDDSLVKLWRTSNGELLNTFTGHDGGVQSLEFSQDGQFLAAGYIVNGYPPGGQSRSRSFNSVPARHCRRFRF